MAVFSALFGSGPTREELVKKRRGTTTPTTPAPVANPVRSAGPKAGENGGQVGLTASGTTTRLKGDAPVVGQAQARGTAIGGGGSPEPPPRDAQGQNSLALAAAARQRRKGANRDAGTLLTAGNRAPTASLNRRTLLGY